MQDISAEELADCIAKNQALQILDVRERLEFHTYNIGGINIPLGKLAQKMEEEELELDDKLPIIVICQRGLRSRTAKHILESAGFKNVRNLIGGLMKFQRIS